MSNIKPVGASPSASFTPSNSTTTFTTRADRSHRDPLSYQHSYDSMRRYAELLALRHDCLRTRHSYYRAMRLLHEHFGMDPVALGEDHFRDYILLVKTRKAWKPKTIRQTVACARIFFIELLGLPEWPVFSQIRTKDHDKLPAVWNKDWGVHLQPFGDGKNIIQYLGAYVCRTAISDARIL